ncbi:hypothetical protein BDV33DRAFT_210712 [Aspergillus novoparasiticus]|uniref:Uncharacterized protein n=1 Tax=Aspergillus novoparasiticus TaxID=986946 RepID=A0A5N6E6C2_9EURO|nr:hypothetical protein BDV33DRAFT_210712 [Aspergillus novoparasiticus]
MTIPTREWRKGFGHKCGTSIERPQDYSMLGSASRPILMDCEDDRASRPDDADGGAIPETPSHRPLSSVCYDSQSHFDFRTFRVSRTNFFDGRVSISYGEMAVQRSTNCECTPAISSFVEDPKSAVQNTNLGRATESEGKVASDREHIHGRSDCNNGMPFPSAKQNSNWAPETGVLHHY